MSRGQRKPKIGFNRFRLSLFPLFRFDATSPVKTVRKLKLVNKSKILLFHARVLFSGTQYWPRDNEKIETLSLFLPYIKYAWARLFGLVDNLKSNTATPPSPFCARLEAIMSLAFVALTNYCGISFNNKLWWSKYAHIFWNMIVSIFSTKLAQYILSSREYFSICFFSSDNGLKPFILGFFQSLQ